MLTGLKFVLFVNSSFLKTWANSAYFKQFGCMRCWKDMITNVVIGGAYASFPSINNFDVNQSQPED